MSESVTILLVEDNPDDAELTRRILSRAKVAASIITVHDGSEALDYFHGENVYAGRDTSIMPELVLLDLKMPRVGGIELLNEMRKQPDLKNIPAIVFTTSDEEKDVIGSYLSGARSFIQKPLDLPKLQTALDELGLDWLGKPEPKEYKRSRTPSRSE